MLTCQYIKRDRTFQVHSKVAYAHSCASEYRGVSAEAFKLMNLIWKEGGNIKPEYENIEAEYRASEDVDLYKFAIASLKGVMPKKAYYKISERIGERLAKDIETLVGFSVADYGNEISPDAIQHISKRHGEHGVADQNLKDIHDVAKMEFVIDNYDDISKGDISTKYRNADGSYANTVILQKRIDDKYYYVVEAVPDAKLKSLHIVTAYINNIKNDTSPQVGNTKSPTLYVRNGAESDMSSVNVSISESAKNTTEK